MYVIKHIGLQHCYSRWAVIIPKIETQIESLKAFFPQCTLSEDGILKRIKFDCENIMLKTPEELTKEKRIDQLKVEIQQDTESLPDKKRYYRKKIDDINTEKKEALRTETLDDDKIVEEKIKTLDNDVTKLENDEKSLKDKKEELNKLNE